MPLSSELFTKEGPGKDRLAKCAESHQFNFFVGKPNLPGTEDAVTRIQTALRLLGFTISDPGGVYGNSTAKAVFAFKSSHRPKPILGPGQTVPDNVVGILTIAALDEAMKGKPPGPTPPGPTPPNPTPPNPIPPPKPIPPSPKPPAPTPPPLPPTPVGRAWPFNLRLKANKDGIFSFRLELTDPVDRKKRDFLTTPVKFTNTLGTLVNCIQIGTLTFPNEATLDVMTLAGVVLKPLDRTHLTGQLLVDGQIPIDDDKVKPFQARAQVNGEAEGQPQDGFFSVVSRLEFIPD